MFEQQLQRIAAEMKTLSFSPDYIESLPLLVCDLCQSGVKNVNGWLQELGSRLGDQEQYLDVWTQGRFALVFSYNEFDVTMNPSGNTGPDLLIQMQGKDIYVEVRRFRTDYAERRRLEEAGPEGTLMPYGDFGKDTKKVIDAVVNKSRQGKGLPDKASYLVAIRSDRDSIDELGFETACGELEREGVRGGGEYSTISGVLFTDGWRNLNTGRSWYLWQNPNAECQRRLPTKAVNILGDLRPPPTHPRPKHLRQDVCDG